MEKLQTGRLACEHFRLETYLEGELTEEAKIVHRMISRGLYIVNPNYKMTDVCEIIDTEEEGYERYIYVEDAVIDSNKRTVTFSNGDGWEYIVAFDDIVGTVLAHGVHGWRDVIITLKGEWVED